MPPIERVIRRFIADSSPCVPIVGVSPTPPDDASLKAPHHDRQRTRIVGRLLAEGSVVALVLAFGWWGMANLASSTLAPHSDSLTSQRDPIYVGGCPVVVPLSKSSARGGVGEVRNCREGGYSHPITSRRPGGGLGEHAHGVERQGEDETPPRTSENFYSTHLGE